MTFPFWYFYNQALNTSIDKLYHVIVPLYYVKRWKRMKKIKHSNKLPAPTKKHTEIESLDDVLEHCIKKGLIEKTPYGYIFTAEFFETLEIYEE